MKLSLCGQSEYGLEGSRGGREERKRSYLCIEEANNLMRWN